MWTASQQFIELSFLKRITHVKKTSAFRLSVQGVFSIHTTCLLFQFSFQRCIFCPFKCFDKFIAILSNKLLSITWIMGLKKI